MCSVPGTQASLVVDSGVGVGVDGFLVFLTHLHVILVMSLKCKSTFFLGPTMIPLGSVPNLALSCVTAAICFCCTGCFCGLFS